jgi:hypothetical protein
MTPIDTSRFHAALRRYGQAGRIDRDPVMPLHLLVSDLAPMKHSDLPADGIRAEALALVGAAHPPPREGETITAGAARWIIRAAVPVEVAARNDTGASNDTWAGGDRIYQVQLAAAPGVAP